MGKSAKDKICLHFWHIALKMDKIASLFKKLGYSIEMVCP